MALMTLPTEARLKALSREKRIGVAAGFVGHGEALRRGWLSWRLNWPSCGSREPHDATRPCALVRAERDPATTPL